MKQTTGAKKMLLLASIILFIGRNLAQHTIESENIQTRSLHADVKPKTSMPLQDNGMRFTPNKGQIADMDGKLCSNVLYKGDRGGADIYLRKTGISYVYSNMGEVMHNINEGAEEAEKYNKTNEAREQKLKEELMQKANIKVHRIDMDFVNCNRDITTVNEDESNSYFNFYYAHCPNGITNVKQYNKVTYKNIYNNIDVSYYGNQETGIKYDLIVKPHADPNQIKLGWKGAENIHINNEGHLVIKTSVNEFTESIPKVYQVINGKVIDIPTTYSLTLSRELNPTKEAGRTGEWIITFKISNYEIDFPLVIDPWATYYGGNRAEFSTDIATDKIGNVVITGYLSTSVGLPSAPGPIQIPVTAGAAQSVYGGGFQDAFVAKFGLTGNCLWATFYGGSGGDRGMAIATDNAGNVIITGFTTSATDLPIQVPLGAYTQAYGGNGEAFVAKYNPLGLLTWSTFYGGSTLDCGFGIATDNFDNMIVTGGTQSVSIPGAIGSSAGSVDAFVVKFASACTLTWATFYGGTGLDYGFAIVSDIFNNLVITGYTTSTNFPVLTPLGTYTQLYGGGSDAFIVKFNSAGAATWATYYGGSAAEYTSNWFFSFSTFPYGGDIATDNLGNIIITGITQSANLPITTGVAFQSAFLVKFNNAGVRQWATFVAGCEVGIFIATDPNNNIYLLMETEDKIAPNLVDACAYQQVFNEGSSQNFSGGPLPEDQLIVKFTPNGQRICTTYLGGKGEDDLDFGGGIAIFGNSLNITGVTDGGYPVTPGAFQTIYAGPYKSIWGVNDGGSDVFVTSICTNICESKTLGLAYTTSATSACTNEPIKFTPSVNTSCDTTGYKFEWTFPGGNPATSTAATPLISYTAPGNYTTKLIVTTICKKDSITNTNYITVNSCCTLSSQTSINSFVSCNGGSNGSAMASISNGSGGPYTYSWSNGISGITTNTNTTVTNLTAATYTVTISEGACSISSTVTITSPPPFSGQSTKGTANCANCGCKEWIMVTATGGTSPYTYNWPDGYVMRYKNSLCPGTYTVNIRDQNGCSINVNLTAP